MEGPDIDVNLPKADIDVNLPSVDVKAPEIDIQAPDAKLHGPNIKLPSISGPKLPEWDLKLKGPKVKGDVDVSVPKIEGDIKGPKLDIEGPDVDLDGKTGGFKMPKFKMPSFGFKGSHGEGPEVDVSLPEADIDIRAPDIDIKGPEVDLESPSGKIKGPKFKIPTITGPNISMPDVDFNLKGPNLKGGVDVSVPKIKGDIGKPDIDFKGPGFDIEGPKAGFDMPKIKMPTFKGSKMEGPDIDVNLPRADIDVNVPSVDIKAPAIDIEGPDANLQGPRIKFPSISGPKLSDWDTSFKGPTVKGDVSIPKIECDIKGPNIDSEGPDVDIDGKTGGFKMPKFKIPSFGFKGSHVEGPEIDVSLPEADIDIRAPDIDIKGPEVDLEGPSGKIKGPKFQIPTITGPHISMPDVDFKVKGPNLKGGVDLSVPKIKGDIGEPDIDIKGPGIGIEGTKAGFEMPKVKVSNLKGPKMEGSDVHVNLPKADIGVKTPGIDIKSKKDFKAPDLNVNLKDPKIKGEIDASVPSITVEGGKTGITFPKFKGPKFGVKSPEIEGPDSMVKSPKFSVGAKGTRTLPVAEASLDAPDIDISVKGKKGKFKLPKVKTKTKKSDLDIEMPAVNLDVDTPSIHVKGTKVKKPLFGKLHFPDVELDIKSPKLKGEHDIDLPSGSLNTSFAGSGVGSPNVSFGGSMPNVKGGAGIDASVSGSSGIGRLQYPEGTVTFPKIKVPKFGFVFPQLEGQECGGNVETELLASGGMNLQSPSVSCQASSQHIEDPSSELKHGESKVKVKMPNFFGKSKAKGSSASDIRGPEVEFSNSGKGKNVSKDVNVFTGEVMVGKLEVEGDPRFDVSTKGKSASLDLFKKSRHRSSLSDEEGLAVSSPSVHLAEGGDISLDLGGSKVKGKKSKLKFGTFGGFGSKSKGSYEVALGEDSEAGAEGSASLSLPSKKSRLSSSSSSDSGSRGAVRFPRVEMKSEGIRQGGLFVIRLYNTWNHTSE
ncbi:hypothetical protein JOB18_007039 [Solea senegalensis]|uniref:AHNAK nucleoprotein n=2 Tax=Solea senegalensis TaxID=28829 RepID=A0AAV6SLY9_SOLSE|nr:hypothetical protein JOB18_007039 [Solea senegalensis]